jgi:hypothetical protein
MENTNPQDILPGDDGEALHAERSPSTAFPMATENGLPQETSQLAETESQNEIDATSSDRQAFVKSGDSNEVSDTVVPSNESVLMQEPLGDEEDELDWDGYDKESIPKDLRENTIWWPREVGINTKELRRTARKKVDTWRSMDTLPSINPEHCPYCRVYLDSWDSVIRKSVSIGNRILKLATPFHKNFDHLILSAFRGCPLCKYILSIFRIRGRKDELPGHTKEDFRYERGTYLELSHGYMRLKSDFVGTLCYRWLISKLE